MGLGGKPGPLSPEGETYIDYSPLFGRIQKSKGKILADDDAQLRSI